MPAPNQGRTAIKLHGVKLQKCRHPNSEKPPRPNTAKLPLNIPSPLPGSPGNRMRKVHGKSEERYRNQRRCTIIANSSPGDRPNCAKEKALAKTWSTKGQKRFKAPAMSWRFRVYFTFSRNVVHNRCFFSTRDVVGEGPNNKPRSSALQVHVP